MLRLILDFSALKFNLMKIICMRWLTADFKWAFVYSASLYGGIMTIVISFVVQSQLKASQLRCVIFVSCHSFY